MGPLGRGFAQATVLTDFIDSHGDSFGYAAFRLRDTIESVTYKH